MGTRDAHIGLLHLIEQSTAVCKLGVPSSGCTIYSILLLEEVLERGSLITTFLRHVNFNFCLITKQFIEMFRHVNNLFQTLGFFIQLLLGILHFIRQVIPIAQHVLDSCSIKGILHMFWQILKGVRHSAIRGFERLRVHVFDLFWNVV